MLIKSIEITNFRIFAGTQKVDFSTDPDKNVTIIMGDNGSGKTTFSQAFSWCLYGTTTFKKNKNDLLSFVVRDSLEVGKSTKVQVCITIIQNDLEYRILRYQDYRKDSPTKLHIGDIYLRVSYKASDGQEEFIQNEADKRNIINQIIPESISSYFFFDGERVERMGNEIQEGRSKEFKTAVDNLLGLSAISAALHHLKGGSTSVISSYLREYNPNSDSEYQKAEGEIQAAEERIEKLNSEIDNLNDTKKHTAALRDEYRLQLEQARESRAWAEDRNNCQMEIKDSENQVKEEIKQLNQRFSNGSWKFFAAPLFESALSIVENSSLPDIDVPRAVNADTIEDIIDRGKCLCGTPIEFNSSEYNALMGWLQVVPPEHLGGALKSYKDECTRTINDQPEILIDDVDYHINNISRYDKIINENRVKVDELSQKLANVEDVSSIERNYQTASTHLNEIDNKISNCTQALGQTERALSDARIRRDSYTTNDKTNRRVRRDKVYAEWIYDELSKEYQTQEDKTRNDLEKEINNIFREFFNGSLELSLDDKYNIIVKNNDPDSIGYDVETSEGQTIAVIFAFIAGVIRLATDPKRMEDEMLLTDEYPLVMDAPMSKLDKKRIEAVCKIVPQIAKQVIIMIKDTDGELVLDYLVDKIGTKYEIVSIETDRYSEIKKVD